MLSTCVHASGWLHRSRSIVLPLPISAAPLTDAWPKATSTDALLHSYANNLPRLIRYKPDNFLLSCPVAAKDLLASPSAKLSDVVTPTEFGWFAASWLDVLSGDEHRAGRQRLLAAMNSADGKAATARFIAAGLKLIEELSFHESTNLAATLSADLRREFFCTYLGLDPKVAGGIERLATHVGAPLFSRQRALAAEHRSELLRDSLSTDPHQPSLGRALARLAGNTDATASQLANLAVNGPPLVDALLNTIFHVLRTRGKQPWLSFIDQDPPQMIINRTLIGEIMIGGHQFQPGARMAIVTGSCNAALTHGKVTFGYGPHACPGRGLARKALAVWVPRLLTRLSPMPGLLHCEWDDNPNMRVLSSLVLAPEAA
jgi:cytochrome P450